MKAKVPEELSADHVIQALKLIDEGLETQFGPSTKYDLLYNGKRYAPKEVVGVASEVCDGTKLTPNDINGGGSNGAGCNPILSNLGFDIERKPGYQDGKGK